MLVLSTMTGIVGAVLAVGLLIVVHELGHFLACRLVGVRVERFSIGFGPVLLRWQPGATEYALSAIPLGGYVKMAGEDPGEEGTGAPDEFFSHPPGHRAVIIVAGVVMNAVLAVVCFIIAFQIGVKFPKPEVGYVTPGGPAARAGLEPGDEIVGVGGWRNIDYPDVQQLIAFADPQTGINLTARRDGVERTVRLYPEASRSLGMPVAGFEPAMSLRVQELVRGFPAQEAGMEPGDRIVALNGTPVTSWPELQQRVQESGGRELSVTVERKGERLTFPVSPEATHDYLLGARAWQEPPVVQQVADLGPGERAGLQVGDLIEAVDGREVKSWADFDAQLASAGPGEAQLTIRRGEETRELMVELAGGRAMWAHHIGVLGETLVVGTVEPGGPAERAGLTPGTEIVAAGADAEELMPLRFWEQLEAVVDSSHGQPLVLRVIKEGEPAVVTVTPERGKATGRYLIGIQAAPKEWMRKAGFLDAVGLGCKKSVLTALQIYLFLRRMLFTHTISSNQLAGPITIGYITYKAAATASWSRLLYLLGVVGINLSIINLFPIPILDGGHLVVIGVEKLKGSPISRRALALAQYVGLALLISLFLWVTYNDITRHMKTLLGG